MKAWSGMGQTGKASRNPITTRAHAEYGRDQAMGSPCYPDEGCFLAMDGSVLLDDPNSYLGRVLKGRGVHNHEL